MEKLVTSCALNENNVGKNEGWTMYRKKIKGIMTVAVALALTVTPLAVPMQNHTADSVIEVSAKTKMTWKKAKKKLVRWMKKRGEYNKDYDLVYDHYDNEQKQYVFHYYNFVNDHTATMNWYYVSKKTGKITSML